MSEKLYLKQWKYKDGIYPSYSASFNFEEDGKNLVCGIGDIGYNKETNEYEFNTNYDPMYITQNEMEQIIEMMKGLNAKLTQECYFKQQKELLDGNN